MKCVHETPSRTLAHLLRSALESEGVATFVQGEHLTPLQGETPAGASAQYRVCLVDDEQWPKAQRVVADFLDRQRGAGAGRQAWTCASCGERHEAQFVSCWRCGADAA